MNDPAEDSRRIEVSEQQINDIKTLRDNLSFNRYFMARLKRRRDKLKDDALTLDDPYDREKSRQLYVEYEKEILSFMDRDFKAAITTIENQSGA